MKFLILLRSINISGKNIVKMNKLKEELLSLKKYKSVETIIQSGNIIVDTSDGAQDINEIESNIALVLESKFKVENPKMVVYDLESFSTILSNCSVIYNGRDNIKDKSYDKLMLLFPCTDKYLDKECEEKEKEKMNDTCYWTLNDNVIYYNGFIGSSIIYRSLDKNLKSLYYTSRNYRTCQKCLLLLST